MNEAEKGDLTWCKHMTVPQINASYVICHTEAINLSSAEAIRTDNPKLLLQEYLEKEEIRDKLVAPHPHYIFTVEGEVHIGKNVLIGENCSIGVEGASYVRDGKALRKLKHIGRVIIEDDVEIGCNVVICRGVLGDTIIRKGTKIGHNVQIGHNVEIEEHCLILPKTLICGSAKIGAGSYIAPNVTVINGAKVPTNSFIKTNEVYK